MYSRGNTRNLYPQCSAFHSDEGGKRTELEFSSDEDETAPEKKLRLAKEYLANLEQEGK